MMSNEKVKFLKGKDKIIKIAFSKGPARSVNKYICFQCIRPLKGFITTRSQTSEAQSLPTNTVQLMLTVFQKERFKLMLLIQHHPSRQLQQLQGRFSHIRNLFVCFDIQQTDESMLQGRVFPSAEMFFSLLLPD